MIIVYSIIAASILILIVSILFLAKRKKRVLQTLEQEFQEFQSHINAFFTEYTDLTKEIVEEHSEKTFSSKWFWLYEETSKYKIPKKSIQFSAVTKFNEVYKNIHEHIYKSNSEIRRKESLKTISEQISTFFNELSKITSEYVSHSKKQDFLEKWKAFYEETKNLDFRDGDDGHSEFEHFKDIYKSHDSYFDSSNEEFIQTETSKYDNFFSNIDGKSLDKQQRAAVITDENRTLVLAGAGSGKTLTIAAKVKYLCEIKKENPKDILLISFTKKSAQEMTERIQNRLGINAEATTFHKLGLDIITQAEGKRPNVFDENIQNKFVHDFFESEIQNHPNLVKNLTEFFAYFLDIPKNLEEYSSLGELYEEEKTSDLETLSSKYEREKYIREVAAEKSQSYSTLKNEKVKSIEEIKIANFLFMHGINYEYEKQYPFESDDPLRKSYHPDFYLNDYDIYLEHFGVSKDFRVPWLSEVEERKYLDGIEWKREFHKTNGTKLIETYSYYSSEGVLFQKLEEILVENGVKLNNRDFTDVFNTVYDSKSNKYFSEFIKLCCTFITLFKSANYRIDEIDKMQEENQSEKNTFFRQRTNLFLDIIKAIMTEYQNYLSTNNAIDFSDMINNAADRISCGCHIHPYKYVIVDEYQDISQARFNFLKTIADRTHAKFFCVGDDWQSIYRFAGSDISLFTDFQKYFGFTKILKIEKTYRNSQNLIDEASSFILRNPKQLQKNLHSDKKLDYPLVFWGYNNEPYQALNSVIKKIVSEFGVNSSILLLGRTNYDFEIVKKSGLFKITHDNRNEVLKYTLFPELKINFLSVHKSKGLEADNVVLLNFTNQKLGFPNQIADDRVLNLVLTNAENFRFAEERRLFYVAITRTKNRTFVLTDNAIPSAFFKEFNESKNVCFVSIKKQQNKSGTFCPRCKTGNLLKVEHNGKYFIGCSNFPNCDYTLRDTRILSAPIKCPSCGGFLVKRKGKNGHWFVGCSNYPYCEYTEPIKNFK